MEVWDVRKKPLQKYLGCKILEEYGCYFDLEEPVFVVEGFVSHMW